LLGRLCTVLAALLLAPLLVCLHDGTLDGETARAFGVTALGTFGLAVALRLVFRFRPERFHLPEAFAIVTGAWIVFAAIGAVPFVMTGRIPNIVDAAFETMSGITTTGASILSAPDVLDRPLLLWRSILQLVGGLGIVALSVAILPALGAGGNFLFQAEAVGPEGGKLLPRISAMAKLLWGVYVGLTLATIGAYLLAGMSPFDAVNHAFTTLATGGFSTRSDSFASYSPAIQWVTVLFMFIAGINFVLLVSVLRGRASTLFRNTEWRVYCGIILAVSTLAVITRYQAEGAPDGIEPLVRSTMFSVVALSTGTGYGADDYNLWPPVMHILLIFLMFCGPCGGSTGGGVKVSRLVIWWKAMGRELRRMLRPTGVFVVKVEDRTIPDGIVLKSLAHLIIMLTAWLGVSLYVASTGQSVETSISAAIASLSCVGPGFDAVGPTQNYAAMSDGAKCVLTAAMLFGRLEFFSLLVLLSPMAWRR
jgi:trk system potassium uptake protein TrkH